MKKIIAFILCVCLSGAIITLFTACTPREEILKIHNWGEYTSQETYKGFESWYSLKTGGKKIKVIATEFDTNEGMYTEIVNKKADYDLVCPSDYMAERMINEGKVKKLYDETIKIVNEAINPALQELIVYDDNLEFSMPYIWGTMGIMYNIMAEGQNDEVMKNWSALFSGDFGKKVYMKDSVRDSYIITALSIHEQELMDAYNKNETYDHEDYRKILEPIFDTYDDLDAVEAKLKAQKDLVCSYEIDGAKSEMQIEKDGKNGKFGMFWSCDAGFVMNVYESDSNFNLRYIVPEEGSNVWVDSFVIPEYAKNEDAANLFIQYLCETDIAYECMDYAGGTTAVIKAADKYKKDILDDEENLFKNKPAGFQDMYIEMLFPSPETLLRCAVMSDFGDKSDDFDDMWERVGIA